jgi:hypothetical protein
MRDAGGFELLHRGLAEGALRAEYSKRQRTILCVRKARRAIQSTGSSPSSRASFRSANPIVRETKLTLIKGFDESAIPLNTQLYLSSWIKAANCRKASGSSAAIST